MRSTGEVMGVDPSFGLAYMKSQLAAGQKLPTKGSVFISVNDWDKSKIVLVARDFEAMGFEVMATGGTADFLKEKGVNVTKVNKVHEGQRPHVVDHIKNGMIDLVINTPSGKKTVAMPR